MNKIEYNIPARRSPKLFLLIITSVIIFLSLNQLSAANSRQSGGTINGVVRNSKNKPLEQAAVVLTGTTYGTTTNREGAFSFKNIPEGAYTIATSYMGMTPKQQPVTVSSGQTTTIDFILIPQNEEIDEVVVNGAFNKFSKKETDQVALLPLKNLENPQVYNVIPKELTNEQMVIDYNDVLRNITGGNVSSSNNSSNQSMLRGFRTFNGLRNGMSSYTLIAIDPANIERVEVLKGPSGTLFGASTGSLVTFGGLMNRITKKPHESFKGNIGYTTGSWGLSRITLDVNIPLKGENPAAFRLNSAYHTENSFQDAGFQRNLLIAPAFSLKASDRLSFSFDAEIYRTTRFLPAYFNIGSSSLSFDNFKDLPLDYNASLSSNDLSSKLGTSNFFAKADYEISDQWKSATSFSYTMTEYFNAYRLYTSWLSDSTVARGIMAQRPQRQIATSLQQNFTGDFSIGNMRNRLVAGLNLYRFTAKLRYTGITIYDIVNLNNGTQFDFSTSALDAILAETTFNNQQNDEKSAAIYVSDVLNVTDRLLLMASLRLGYYKNDGVTINGITTSDSYNQTSLSPKFGIVYQPVIEKVSLFANYMNGYSNQAGSDINGKAFKPLYANQIEGGAKVDLFKNKLNMTLSYYNIEVENVLRSNPDNAAYNIQDGERESKGFEAELVANLFSGFNIIAGYGYNDSRYTKASDNIEGKRPLGTPKHMANMWMSYKIVKGNDWRGLGIGFGGNYSSSSYFDDTNTFSIPDALVLSSSIFFERKDYRLGLKMNNLTDEHYWSYVGSPQNPRQILFNISYLF